MHCPDDAVNDFNVCITLLNLRVSYTASYLQFFPEKAPALSPKSRTETSLIPATSLPSSCFLGPWNLLLLIIASYFAFSFFSNCFRYCCWSLNSWTDASKSSSCLLPDRIIAISASISGRVLSCQSFSDFDCILYKSSSVANPLFCSSSLKLSLYLFIFLIIFLFDCPK